MINIIKKKNKNIDIYYKFLLKSLNNINGF